jgi:hypothetical protein
MLGKTQSVQLQSFDSISGKDKAFVSLLHSVQTGSGPHPVGAGAPLLRTELSSGDLDYSHPPSADVRTAWSCTSTPP